MPQEGDQKPGVRQLRQKRPPRPLCFYYGIEPLEGAERGVDGEKSDEDDEDVYPEGKSDRARPFNNEPRKKHNRVKFAVKLRIRHDKKRTYYRDRGNKNRKYDRKAC